MKYLTGFFAFWYDFIVGDAWEVAAGVVAALVVLGVVARAQPNLAEGLGPLFAVLVMGIMGASLWWERRSRR